MTNQTKELLTPENAAAAAPLWIRAGWIALVVLVAGFFVWALARAGRSRAEQPATGNRWGLGATIALFAYLTTVAVLATSGVLGRFDLMPPAMLRLLFPVTLVTSALAFSPVGTRLVAGTPLAVLIGYQGFRVLVELLLLGTYRADLVPVQMTFEGRNFDVLTGISALLLAALAARREPPRWLLWLWNVGGLLLLVNIVAIAALSMPGPLRHFHNEPANRAIAELPFVWLPTFLVQAALFGHLLMFRWLGQAREE